jgi:Na+-driven multidrug efflux pump
MFPLTVIFVVPYYLNLTQAYILRNLGHATYIFVSNTVLLLALGVPSAYLLAFYFNYGANGIWDAMLGSLTLGTLSCFIRFLSRNWEYDKFADDSLTKTFNTS